MLCERFFYSFPQILSLGRMNKIKSTQKGLCTSIKCYYKPSSEQSKGCKWKVFTWIIIPCPASHGAIKYKTFQSNYWNQECRKQVGEWLIWNVKHLNGCWFSELVSFRAGFLQGGVRTLLCRNTKIGLSATCPISWPPAPFQVPFQLCNINFLLLKWGKCLRGREAAQPLV